MDRAKFYSQKYRIASKLATKLTPKSSTIAFPKLRSPTGNLTKTMDSFLKFYSDLYKFNPPSSSALKNAFLDTFPIPSIAESHRDLL